MEPVFHDVSLLQAHWKDMNQSLMTACYISDQDSDSNNSDVLAVQDSGNAVPSIPFTPIGNRDPAKQLQRAKSAMRRHYYRCSVTLFKKMAEMTTQTGWTGFLVLRSPDGGQYLYGGGGNGVDWQICGSSSPDWCCAHQSQQFPCVHDQGHGQGGENREGQETKSVGAWQPREGSSNANIWIALCGIPEGFPGGNTVFSWCCCPLLWSSEPVRLTSSPDFSTPHQRETFDHLWNKKTAWPLHEKAKETVN